MSGFQKALFQKRLQRAEQQLGFDFSEDAEGEGDEERDSVAALESVGRGAARSRAGARGDAGSTGTTGTAERPQWDQFFDDNTVYELAGGFKMNTYYKRPVYSTQNPIIFVCHQGAGSSGLTFARLAEALQEKFAEKNKAKLHTEAYELPGVLAFDMRGHGRTGVLNGVEHDFSIDRFCRDFAELMAQFMARQQFAADGISPSIFLVGHSLGGSVLTKVVAKGYIQDDALMQMVKGLVMLDIVEDAAVASLSAMVSYLDKTPRQFASLEKCIQWHLDSRLVNNVDSANVSVPSYFRFDDADGHYKWIADLYKTQDFWNDWFVGLSSEFVDIRSSVAKLLILSGHDNLDKHLMIGQMQGKYQLVVFQNEVYDPKTKKLQHCGHFLHEDCPDKVALTLIDFVERNDITRSDKTINIKWGAMR